MATTHAMAGLAVAATPAVSVGYAPVRRRLPRLVRRLVTLLPEPVPGRLPDRFAP